MLTGYEVWRLKLVSQYLHKSGVTEKQNQLRDLEVNTRARGFTILLGELLSSPLVLFRFSLLRVICDALWCGVNAH